MLSSDDPQLSAIVWSTVPNFFYWTAGEPDEVCFQEIFSTTFCTYLKRSSTIQKLQKSGFQAAVIIGNFECYMNADLVNVEQANHFLEEVLEIVNSSDSSAEFDFVRQVFRLLPIESQMGFSQKATEIFECGLQTNNTAKISSASNLLSQASNTSFPPELFPLVLRAALIRELISGELLSLLYEILSLKTKEYASNELEDLTNLLTSEVTNPNCSQLHDMMLCLIYRIGKNEEFQARSFKLFLNLYTKASGYQEYLLLKNVPFDSFSADEHLQIVDLILGDFVLQSLENVDQLHCYRWRYAAARLLIKYLSTIQSKDEVLGLLCPLILFLRTLDKIKLKERLSK